jgi:pimeloyl-ACP methyl ester carboxylesterase
VAYASFGATPGLITRHVVAAAPPPKTEHFNEEITMGTNISRRQVLATGAAVAGSAALMATSLGADAATAARAEAGKTGPKAKPTIVLVHGGYADSSCWNPTIQFLQGKGYTAICGSNPLRGIPTDAPYIGSLLDSIPGPVVLVAHSMGGTVITNAAAGKSNVKALVYIAAFAPDVGETQGELITKFPGSIVGPVSVAVPYTKPDGSTGIDLYLSKDGQAAFAADVSTSTFRLLQATQRPFDADSFIYPTQAAAWRTIPSWGLVAGRDKAIPPETERWMYSRANFRKVIEVPTASHVVMLSYPRVVADLIEDAAKATS